MTGGLPRSPLHEVQKAGRAAFGEVDGWEMPRVFENIKMEYLAAKGTVAVMDRSNHGRLDVSGAKRLDLLNRLSTNDLRGLASGQGTRTALLTDKGRLIDDLRLYAREDRCLLLTSPGNAGRVKETIEKLRFRDDVALRDVTRETAMITLFGPQSAHLLEAVCRAHRLDELPRRHVAILQARGHELLAARASGVGGSGFNLVMDAGAGPAVWEELLGKGAPYGVSPLGEEAWEMLRIEQGLPRFGREITEEFNPLEAGMDEAISWTKGCYVGQEVVARLDSRHKISKLLVGLWLEPGPVPEAGSALISARAGEPDSSTAPLGRITSVAPSLDLRRVLALGYVRADHAAPGSRLIAVSGEDRIGAVAAALPFAGPPPA